MCRPIVWLVFALGLPTMLAVALGAVRPASAEGLERFDLGGRWQVVREGTTEVIPATVPGCIHTDLLAAKKIPDPFFRDNERAVQWIGEANWIYRRSFDVPAELLEREHVLLRCEGLDTLATVRVNGHEVAKADNMFRTYEFDVKKLLKSGQERDRDPLCVRAAVHSGEGEGAETAHLELPRLQLRAEGAVQFRLGLGTDADHLRHLAADRHWWPSIGRRIEDVAIKQDHSQKGKVKLND